MSPGGQAPTHVCRQVSDPARALDDFESYERELHLATQLAVRAAVAERSVDDLLEHRLDLGERLRDLVMRWRPSSASRSSRCSCAT